MKSGSWGLYSAVLAIVGTTAAPVLYFDHLESTQTREIDAASERLSLVPTHFGPWQLREEETLSETSLNMLGCSSHICRTYSNVHTGEHVGLVVLVGPAGPLAVHTPEICMSNREYENIKPVERITIDGKDKKQEFFSTIFRTRSVEGQRIDVYYGWSRDGFSWEAPDSPRMTLGPLPMLYKIQVACADPVVATDGQPTAGVAFLSDLLPLLSQSTAGRRDRD
jgi:hypothetical protein